MQQIMINKYGQVQEEISLQVDYSILERDNSLQTTGKITKKTSLEWGRPSSAKWAAVGSWDATIGNVLDFQEKANALLQEVKNLLASGTYVEVSLVKSAYEDVEPYIVHDELGDHESSLNQIQFEQWIFMGNCLEEDSDEEGAGLYLSPDVRYTDATWDMILYWGKDILKSLAEGHL